MGVRGYPKVMAGLPLAAGGTVDVYGYASRWTPNETAVSWMDDADHSHWAWIPAEPKFPETTREKA